jgi:hypothetical protein
MKKIILVGAFFVFIFCGFLFLAQASSNDDQGIYIKIPKLPTDQGGDTGGFNVAPPPAYIQTHQTQPSDSVDASTNVSATTTNQDSNTESSTTSSTTTISAPPTIIPQELPTNQGEVTADFVVTSVAVIETKTDVKTNTQTAKVIEFQGKAKPNTYVTLYIYSTPIIVTVMTDSQGNWKYDLNQELDDGVHRIYVAQIDNSGNVVAKSDPIFFTKVAASTQLASSDALPIGSPKVNFFQQYFVAIALVILAIAIIVSLTVIGLVHRKTEDLPQ